MLKKRFFSAFLAMALLLGCVPVTVLAEEVPVVLAEEPISEPALVVTEEAAMSTEGGSFGTGLQWEYDSETRTLTVSGQGAIPDGNDEWMSYQHKTDKIVVEEGITAIGVGNFFYFTVVECVTLPSTLISIGERAFEDCWQLEDIHIPDSVTEIGDSAFLCCKKIDNLGSLTGVKSVGSWAFQDCYSLTSIALPNVTSIGTGAFDSCVSLESARLLGAITSMGTSLFDGCNLLKAVEIGEGLTVLPSWTFDGCKALESIALPSSLKTIGSSAFKNCEGLVSMTLPEGLTEIGDYAFAFCRGLKSVVIPERVTAIGNYAFAGCTSLETADLPSGLTSLGERAFNECSSLKTVVIPGGVTTIPQYAFYKCTGLKDVVIQPGVKTIEMYAFYGCSQLQAVSLPDGLETIGQWAFQDCFALETITLPASLKNIEGYCFANCSGLHTITFTGNPPRFGVYPFDGVTAVAYYPAGNNNWNDGTWQSCGGNITPETYEAEIPKVDPPVLTASNRASDGAIVLSWTKVESAVKYEVYRSRRENADFLRIASPTANTLTDEKPTPGDPYYYKVKAILENGTETEFSAVVSCTRKPGKPGNLKVTADGSTGKPTLRWDAVGGAEKYQIWRSKTGKAGSFGLINTVKTLTTTNKNAVLGTKYYYKVRAVYSDGSTSNYSNAVSITCVLPAPKGLKATNDAATGKNVISWNAVEGATKYQVWHSTTGKAGSFKLLMTTKNLSHIHKASVAGKTHYYKVKAIHTNTPANSALTGSYKRTADLARPVVTAGNNATTGKVRLTWKAVTGASKYQVWYSATGKAGTFKLVWTCKNLYFNHNASKVGVTGYYKVMAIHTNTAANSAYSTVVSRAAK